MNRGLAYFSTKLSKEEVAGFSSAVLASIFFPICTRRSGVCIPIKLKENT